MTLAELIAHLNYLSMVIAEYEEGKRDRRFAPVQNAERLEELKQERDELYQQEFCPMARREGFEYLPFPAVPHWQNARSGDGLYLDYAPPPKELKSGLVDHGDS